MKTHRQTPWLTTSLAFWWVATIAFVIMWALMRFFPVAESEVPVFVLRIASFLFGMIGFVTAVIAAIRVRGRARMAAVLAMLLGFVTIGFVFGVDLGSENIHIYQAFYYAIHMLVLLGATLMFRSCLAQRVEAG